MSNAPWITPSSPPPNRTAGDGPAPRPPVAAPDTPSTRRRSRSDAGGSTPDRLTIRRWEDALVEDVGFRPTGFYVERYWGPIVGPSCLLLLRVLARRLETDCEGFDIDASDLAGAIGCSAKSGPASQFWRAVRRAQRFGLMRQVDDRLYVRVAVGQLSNRLVHRLPAHLRTEHHMWVDTAPPPSGDGPARPEAGDEAPAIEILRRAARGLCTPGELRSMDHHRRLV